MKYSRLLFHIFAVTWLIAPITSLAQWQPDVRLTTNNLEDITSLNNARCIVANAGDVDVFWAGGTSGVWDIWHKRSTDAGITWGSSNQVTTLGDAENYPSVWVSGSVIDLVWADNRYAPNWEVYYKRSTDGGISWGAEGRLTDSYENSLYPSVLATGSTVHVVWSENNLAFYKRSTDEGLTWGPGTQLSNFSLTSGVPSISASGTSLHVVWSENNEVYYKGSLDEGASWEADIQLTNDAVNSWSPSVSASGQLVSVVWYDLRDGNHEIYFKRSTNGGASWEADTRLSNGIDVSYNPTVIISDAIMHVVWYDIRDYDFEIYYKRSTDEGVSWGSDVRLTNSVGGSFSPFVSVSGSVVHVVWYDTRDGSSEIYYKRDPTGGVTGIDNTGVTIPDQSRLEQNYPNPFNPSTMIEFGIANRGSVRLTVFDLLGRELTRLVDGPLDPGMHRATWSAQHVAAGVYLYRLEAGEYRETRKLIVLR